MPRLHVHRRQSNRRKVSDKALKAFKAKVREPQAGTQGRTIRQIATELRQLMLGWRAFSASLVRYPLGATWTSGYRRRLERPLEAMGPEAVPGTANARRGSAVGLEYGQVGPWPVASGVRAPRWRSRTAALLRRAGPASPE